MQCPVCDNTASSLKSIIKKEVCWGSKQITLLIKPIASGLFVSVLLLGLMGCDQKTRQGVTNKADQMLEKVDAKVDKVAKQPNALQSVGQSVDQVVDSAHQTTHMLMNKPTVAPTTSSSPTTTKKP